MLSTLFALLSKLVTLFTLHTFFQAIETYLPPAVWVSHYSDMDNRHSLALILPNTHTLSFIAHFKHHPILAPYHWIIYNKVKSPRPIPKFI